MTHALIIRGEKDWILDSVIRTDVKQRAVGDGTEAKRLYYIQNICLDLDGNYAVQL